MNKEKLESARNLFFIALGIDVAVTALVVISDFWGVGVLKDIDAGIVTADQSLISRLEFWDSFAKLMLLTMLGVGLGLVKWLNTCYGYAKEAIGASGFKNEGWTAGAWIIPIFNMFKPYQVINEIYKAGSPTYDEPDGWKKDGGSGLLLAWWIFWAVTHFIGWIVGKQIFQSAMRDDLSLQQSIVTIQFHAWFCIVFLLVSGLWFVVAHELTRRLLERRITVESSLLSGQSVSGSNHQCTAQPSPMPSVTTLSNEGISKGQVPVCSASTSTEKNSPPVQNSTVISTMPMMKTDPATEEGHWATAMAEVETGQRRPGVWAKAFAECDGDETKAKVAYLKYRVKQLTDVAAELVAKVVAEKTQAEAKAKTMELEMRKAFGGVIGLYETVGLFVANEVVSDDQLKFMVREGDKAQLSKLCNSITGNFLLHVCAERDMLLEVDALLRGGADTQRSNVKGQLPELMAKNWATRLLIKGSTISIGQLIRAVEVGVDQYGDMFSCGNHTFQDLQEAIDYAASASKIPR